LLYTELSLRVKVRNNLKFLGMWNFGGGGTETILGVANFNIPSHTENVCFNEKVMFSGQITNLSRELIHVTVNGFGSAQVSIDMI